MLVKSPSATPAVVLPPADSASLDEVIRTAANAVFKDDEAKVDGNDLKDAVGETTVPQALYKSIDPPGAVIYTEPSDHSAPSN
jgi:hypothetical protein